MKMCNVCTSTNRDGNMSSLVGAEKNPPMKKVQWVKFDIHILTRQWNFRSTGTLTTSGAPRAYFHVLNYHPNWLLARMNKSII